jgi:TRAP-type C4-dicarboxylate transport system permease small subunit
MTGDLMERWRAPIARLCGLLAAMCLLAMMLLTAADVVLRAMANAPIHGAFEVVELLLAGTFFLGLPAVFLREDNILVNMIDSLAPRLVPALDRIAALLAVGIFALMGWQSAIAALDSWEFNDVTGDLGLSRMWHWAAVLAGLVGTGVVALYFGLRRGGSDGQ